LELFGTLAKTSKSPSAVSVKSSLPSNDLPKKSNKPNVDLSPITNPAVEGVKATKSPSKSKLATTKAMDSKSVATKAAPAKPPTKSPAKLQSKTPATKATTSKPAKASQPKEPEKSWYDYPHYYDVGFREDTPREAKFFEKAFAKYIPGKVKRVFEPGCGSGRLVVEMAERGFQVTGLDLNQPALDYCKEQLDKKGLKATLINGDMTAFELKRPADAAFNTINTFRHLLTEEDAVKHLKCVAANLRPGGIYILGLHLLPTGGDFYGSEKWKAKEGRTQINYSLTVVDSLPKQRHEKLRITMTIKKGKSVVRVSDHFTLRLYNYKNIKTLFAQVPELVLRDVYDFWYEIDEPQKLDGNIADSVFILQKPE
jgi:SAM-dependent methyltransferase